MPLIFVPSSAKRILTQILVVSKLNERKDLVLVYVNDLILPANNYLLAAEAKE